MLQIILNMTKMSNLIMPIGTFLNRSNADVLKIKHIKLYQQLPTNVKDDYNIKFHLNMRRSHVRDVSALDTSIFVIF